MYGSKKTMFYLQSIVFDINLEQKSDCINVSWKQKSKQLLAVQKTAVFKFIWNKKTPAKKKKGYDIQKTMLRKQNFHVVMKIKLLLFV